ncbi:MAG: hypothetical protein ACR2J8_08280, partial [Thermomicrobiales bacterium]
MENAPNTATPNGRRATLLSLGVLLLLTAVALANRFAFDTWLARFDLYTFFVPWYAYLGERLRAFDIPGWNPHLFSGTPFAGDPESGWMYLPAMIAFTIFPVLTGFKALAVFHLAIASLGAWLLGRSLGFGRIAALASALAYVTAPLLQWNSYCCLVLNQFAVWMPLLLLGIDLGLRQASWRNRIAPWSLAALAISQMYAGWIGQGWLLAPLLTAAWVGYRTLLDPARPLDALRARLAAGVGAGAISLGFGLLLGAAGILPRIEANRQSNVPFGDYGSHGSNGILNPPWSLPHLLAQVMGNAYERRSAAIGGAVLVLALLAIPLVQKRYAAPFFAGLGLLTLLLTMPTTPIHWVLYVIPGMRSFHDHDAWRVYALAPLCFAMLAGASVEALPGWRSRSKLRWLALMPLLLMIAAALLIRPSEGFIGWPPLIAAALMTLAILAATFGPNLPAVWLPAAAVALIYLQPVGVDLASSWLGWPAQPSWDRHWNPDPVVAEMLHSEIGPAAPGSAGEFLQQRLAEDGPFRYVGYGGVSYPDTGLPANYMARRFEPGIHAIMVNGRPMFLGLYETQGYNPLELNRYAAFMTALNGQRQDYHTAYLLPSGVDSPMLDLLDVRYIVVDNAIPAGRDDLLRLQQGRHEVFRDDLVSIWERDVTPAHAWIVHDYRELEPDQILPSLASGAIDTKRTVLLERGQHTYSPTIEANPAGGVDTAIVTRYEPDEIEIEIASQGDGMLIVSEAWSPDWHADVDGS